MGEDWNDERVRWLLVLLALAPVGPTAQGLTVSIDAPQATLVPGPPTTARVSLDHASGPVELKAWLGGSDWQASRTWNGTAFQRSDQYALTVEPDRKGQWTGRVWVRPNPSSSNADRLDAATELLLGVRVRSSGSQAETFARLESQEPRTRGWAATEPGVPVRVSSGGEPLLAIGWPHEPRPVEVPVARAQQRICDEHGCGTQTPWRLTRVETDRVRVSTVDGRVHPHEPSVLVHGTRACTVGADADPAAVRWVRLTNRSEEGRCVDADLDEGTVARWVVRGSTVSRAPDRPGRGAVVWDPVEDLWAPWRLPGDTEPRPIESLSVEGPALAFATEADGLDVLRQVVAMASEQVTASTYLLTSQRAAQGLASTARRGVDVDLYVEPDPIGGLPDVTEGLLSWLEARGVHVHRTEDPSDAGLQHAKVVVVDSSLVVVLTENMTDSGLPATGQGNLGVGLAIANATLAGRVEAVFQTPGEGRSIQPQGWDRIDGTVQVLTAPENAWRDLGVPAWIQAQEGPIQGAVLRANPRWGPVENPWLAAMVNQSQDHPVNLVFSGAPEGAARSNREAIAHVLAHPDAGNVSARLSDPREGTLHAKVIVGPEGVLVGSSNWGLGGALMNRELNLLVRDPALADEVGSILAEPAPRSLQERLRASGPVPLIQLATVLVAVGGATALRSRLAARSGRPPAE